MRRLIPAMVLLAGCSIYRPPAATAPACPAGDTYVNVEEGAQLHCKPRPGQRVQISFRRGERTVESLRIVCVVVLHGQFVHNFGDFDYCVLG